MEFGVWMSVMIFLLVVIGGKKSLLGPVIGAIFLTIVPEILRGAKIYAPLFYAVLVLVVIFILPEGLISLPDRIKSLKKNAQKSATG
jgi:branched-chain amino acid transport system permease protein